MNQPLINDPIAAMREEVKTTDLFAGIVLMNNDGEVTLFHAECDNDIVHLAEDGDEAEFSDVLEEVLKHLAECDGGEDEDDDDIEEIDLSDEE